jgi:hypothetical protein
MGREVGYTLAFYAYNLTDATRILRSPDNPPNTDRNGEYDLYLRLDRIIADGAVPIGDLGYPSPSGNIFRTWLTDLSTVAGVDLTRLEQVNSLNPHGADTDFPSFGGLPARDVATAVERLTAAEQDGALDDSGQELLILLERAAQRHSDIVTCLS